MTAPQAGHIFEYLEADLLSFTIDLQIPVRLLWDQPSP
jgi:hypothetical protein